MFDHHSFPKANEDRARCHESSQTERPGTGHSTLHTPSDGPAKRREVQPAHTTSPPGEPCPALRWHQEEDRPPSPWGRRKVGHQGTAQATHIGTTYGCRRPADGRDKTHRWTRRPPV